MALGDYRKNRRKCSAVAVGTAFSNKTTGVLSATKLPVGTITFDPLSTMATSGTVKFTAPYSRFYRIEVVSPYTSVTTSATDNFNNPREYNSKTSTHKIRMYVNGSIVMTPASIGGVYQSGILSVSFYTAFDGSKFVASIDNDETTFGAARTVFTTWLNSGDYLEFDYIGEVFGLLTTGVSQIGAKASVGGTTGFIDGANFTPWVAGSITQLIGDYNLNTTYSSTLAIVFGDATVAADYYIEINELDRE